VEAIHPGTLLAAGETATQNLSIFAPASPATQSIQDLAILTGAIFALILVLVEGILLYNIWRFRARAEVTAEPAQVYGSQPVEIAWTTAPTLIVFFLILAITRTLWEAKAAQPAPELDDHALFIKVTGHQWWWEYTYENYDGRPLNFTTANELHMPVSETDRPRRVHLTLESADVCHSFWVPRLNGKMDLLPGRTNYLMLETELPGLFLGQCAEYCGDQHANMLLRVIVEPPADFDRWLANESAPAAEDVSAQPGREAFMAESCVNCHRIGGTPAEGTVGPDLTHLMGRQTLASGEVPNSPETLTEWIRNPQATKPGCLMPSFDLSETHLESIVNYLLTLR
jgi:cytochrome c oxidase subunit 2